MADNQWPTPNIPVSTGRSDKNTTPSSSDQDVVNSVYKKGHGPANSAGAQVARGILNNSKKMQTVKNKAKQFGAK